MAPLQRIRVAVSGLTGGPGVSTFYALDAAALQTPLVNLFAGVKDQFPDGLTWLVADSGDTIDAATGDLIGGWVGIVPGPVTSSGGTTGYAAPAGGCITWVTQNIFDGSRVKGRTFMVPLKSTAYDTDGTLSVSARTELTNSAAAYVLATATNSAVWHRPLTAAEAAKRVPPGVAHVGAIAMITGSSVKDKAAVLRSRRD